MNAITIQEANFVLSFFPLPNRETQIKTEALNFFHFEWKTIFFFSKILSNSAQSHSMELRSFNMNHPRVKRIKFSFLFFLNLILSV